MLQVPTEPIGVATLGLSTRTPGTPSPASIHSEAKDARSGVATAAELLARTAQIIARIDIGMVGAR